MNAQLFLRRITVLLVLVALLFNAASCMKKGSSGKSSNVDYWTCKMHPSVHAKDPGKCPICSMDLVPVMKGSANPASKNDTNHDHATMLAGKPTSGGERQGRPGMPGMKRPADTKATTPGEEV